MDNSDDFSSYGKRGETIAQGRPTLAKTSHNRVMEGGGGRSNVLH
jgi:hypothetical protein